VKHRAKKEAYFLRASWHQALTVNNWRAKINLGIQVDCPSCELATPHIVTHRFWNCQGPSWYGRWLLPYCSNSRATTYNVCSTKDYLTSLRNLVTFVFDLWDCHVVDLD